MRLTYPQKAIACLKISSDENPYITAAVVEQIQQLVAEVNSNPEVKVVILSGTQKYFSLGAQREVLLSSIEQGNLSSYIPQFVNSLTSINFPMIAAMEGHAVAGGLAIGLWCDIAIFAEESLYGVNFMALGFTPGMNSCFLLEEAFGKLLAHEMLYTGKLIKGHELKSSGVPFRHNIVSHSKVFEHAYELALEISQNSRDALMLLKKHLTSERIHKSQNSFQQEQEMHKQLFHKQAILDSIKENYFVTKG